MKAIVYNKKKSKDKFEYSEIETPSPNENELLIKIRASSVNAADCRLLQMGFPPKKKIFGADIAGVVESVGKNVTAFKPGDFVIGELSNFGFGGFAEYVVAPFNALSLKPAGISFEEAAALPLAGVTALQALRDNGNIQKGQKVLIIGSSGGVGTFAIQLAKYFGADITGVCSSITQTKLLGADQVIDYTKEDFSKRNEFYDLILVVNGNYPLLGYKKKLNQNGKLVLVGGSLSQIFKSLLFGKLLSIGSKKVISVFAKFKPADLEFLVNLVQTKKIKPVIEKTYNIEHVQSAMRYVAEGHSTGKVLVKVS